MSGILDSSYGVDVVIDGNNLYKFILMWMSAVEGFPERVSLVSLECP